MGGMQSRRWRSHGAAVAAVAWLMAAAGCVHTKRTEIVDEARTPVEFENELAGRIFHEAFGKLPNKGEGDEQVTRVELPLLFSDERRVVKGPAAAFNRAVRECDTNGDRRITEVEARIWAGTK